MARTAKYLAKMHACVNIKEIEKFYIKARLLRKETGLAWKIDHIIPINGKNVCGLHVENKMRVVTKDENKKKKNCLLEEFTFSS